MKFSVMLLLCLSVIHSVSAQKEYKGSMVIFYKDSVAGKITVSLDKPNNEMIPIVSTTTTKTRNGKERVKKNNTLTAKWNAGAITALYVNKKRYVFRDLKDTYGDSTIRYNCTVVRVAGTDSLGLFEFVDQQHVSHYYIQTPNDGRRIYNIAHPYVAGAYTSFAGLRFTMRCPAVAKQISDHASGFFYDENSSKEAMVAVWKNVISEYYKNCSR